MSKYALTMENIRAGLSRNNVPHLWNEQLQQIAIPRPGAQEWAVRIIPRPDRNMMSFGLVMPFKIPAERLEAFHQAINIVNNSTFMGSWIYNTNNGTGYFRFTVPVVDAEYGDQALTFMLRAVIGSVDAVAPRLRAVVLEGLDPAEVLPAESR